MNVYHVLFTGSAMVYPVNVTQLLSGSFPLCFPTSSFLEFRGHYEKAPLRCAAVENITNSTNYCPSLPAASFGRKPIKTKDALSQQNRGDVGNF